MAKVYIGHNDVAKPVRNIYIGVDGKAKQVKNAYIGIGGKAKLWYSTEASFYTQTILPSGRTFTWPVCAYGNGRFVIISRGETGYNAVYSTDGVNWSLANSLPNKNWSSVCYGDGKFVAVAEGNTNTAAYSTDGVTWASSNTFSSSVSLQSVTYASGKYVAVSDNSKTLASSSDGVTWTLTTPFSSSGWNSVTYGLNMLVAVGGNGNCKAAYSLTGGTSWTEVALPTDSTTTNIKWEVCYGGFGFVAVAYNSGQELVAAQSSNAMTWTKTTMPSGSQAQWNGIAYGNWKYAVSHTNLSMVPVSNNGTTWTAVQTGRSDYATDVCYGDDKFLFAIRNSDYVVIGSGL